MKISTVLDHIDSGHMALPEFQRGYVWNRDQVRGLMDSLYRGHPVGSLLVWVTQAEGATHRGGGALPTGVVKLLLDGQQRMTSLYGIIRGKPPRFFDGNAQTFSGLHFHLEREEFAFYSPIKMDDDPRWVDVSALMKAGNGGLGAHIARFSAMPALLPKVGDYVGRLSRILAVQDLDLHVEEVTGADKSIDVVVEIFNRVNSGGTKLSSGDLALAKICADWPTARDQMKAALKKWRQAGFQFDLDWLLRNMNTVVTGEAKFTKLHAVPADKVQDGLERSEKAIDFLLNLIAGRLGLDHDQVFFGRYALPVMVHYLDRRGGHLTDSVERDRLLFWYVHSALWGRFSSSVESLIDKDLKVLEEMEGGMERLVAELHLWHGGLRVLPDHFGGWSLGARFYPMLYLLTRVGEAQDWGTGLPLRHQLLGKMSRLEVHHIFPKAQLYKSGFSRSQVNAVSNFCFLTKDTNLQISDRRPEEYFPEIEAKHPGALASQWIPTDPELWRIPNYADFLEARKGMLADAANTFLDGLAHGLEVPTRTGAGSSSLGTPIVVTAFDLAAPKTSDVPSIPGSIDSEEEDATLRAVNDWVMSLGLPEGRLPLELSHPLTGEPLALLDLAWPGGLQEGLSRPVAVLINEGPATYQAANEAGFLYFTSVDAFRRYVLDEVLAGAASTAESVSAG